MTKPNWSGLIRESKLLEKENTKKGGYWEVGSWLLCIPTFTLFLSSSFTFLCLSCFSWTLFPLHKENKKTDSLSWFKSPFFREARPGATHRSLLYDSLNTMSSTQQAQNQHMKHEVWCWHVCAHGFLWCLAGFFPSLPALSLRTFPNWTLQAVTAVQ